MKIQTEKNVSKIFKISQKVNNYLKSPAIEIPTPPQAPSNSQNSNVYELKILNNQLYGISRDHASYQHQPSSIITHSHVDTHEQPSSGENKSKMTR